MSISDFPQEISSEEQIDPLTEPFDYANDETDWFKRLAWLIQCQTMMKESIKSVDEFDKIIKNSLKDSIGFSMDIQLRDYYESTCDLKFPASFIEAFKPPFLTRISRIIRTRGGLKQNDKLSQNELIEKWLSMSYVPQWVYMVPQHGLYQKIEERENDIENIKKSKDNTIAIAHGAVVRSFIACENILCQLVSFYGRFLFKVFDGSYRKNLLTKYDADAYQISQNAWEEKLSKLNDEYLKLENMETENHEAVLRQFVEYVLSEKFPRSHSTRESARGLRNWNDKGPNFRFSAWVELLKQLDAWINTDAFGELERFEKTFGRRWLFPKEKNTDPDVSEIQVLKFKKDDLKIDYEKIKRNNEPRIIQELRCLNELRIYYAHNKSPEFLSDNNSDNFKESSLKILSALNDLFRRLQDGIFPDVIVPRRFIQVESDWVRMDYIREDNPHLLRHIRINHLALDHLKSLKKGPGALLNQEVYLIYQRSDCLITRSLYILPVDEM